MFYGQPMLRNVNWTSFWCKANLGFPKHGKSYIDIRYALFCLDPQEGIIHTILKIRIIVHGVYDTIVSRLPFDSKIYWHFQQKRKSNVTSLFDFLIFHYQFLQRYSQTQYSPDFIEHIRFISLSIVTFHGFFIYLFIPF